MDSVHLTKALWDDARISEVAATTCCLLAPWQIQEMKKETAYRRPPKWHGSDLHVSFALRRFAQWEVLGLHRSNKYCAVAPEGYQVKAGSRLLP